MCSFCLQVVIRLLFAATTIGTVQSQNGTAPFSPAPTASSAGIDVYTPPECDYYNDGCHYQVEGICDAGNACLRDTDCFDCSACAGFHLDCSGCVANGCVYCPSDGVCSELPLGKDFWAIVEGRDYSKKSSCRTETDWASTCQSTSSTDSYQPNDPLFSAQQWAYSLLNVEPVWKQGIFGEGVVIRINDPDGVDVNHPEFEGRFLANASCDTHLPETRENSHGTAVASIALAAHNNHECAMGIAPKAFLSACLGPTAIQDELAVEFFSNGLATTHISVNSWGFDACDTLPGVGYMDDATIMWTDDDANNGITAAEDRSSNNFKQSSQEVCPFNTTTPNNPCGICAEWGFRSARCEPLIVEYCRVHYAQEEKACAEFLDLFVTCGYNTLSPLAQTTLTRGIMEGRGGHGIVYIFAAGNEHDLGEDINMEGWLNSRFTLVVGAVDREGFHAPYSTTGSALFISGPGGDHEYLHNNIAAQPKGGCTDASVGTSFAAPAVAGGIALMLEVNPQLGWRDVQGILATTAGQVDPEHFSWTTNDAGLHHSNYYGFGIMDVFKAVDAAKTWTNFGREQQLVVESGTINLQIVDDVSKPAESTISIRIGDQMFSTESVVVYLQLDHASRGDLQIMLTSPGGAKSLLHPPHRPENQHLEEEERWKLLTLAFYGENPQGDWTLNIADASPGRLSDCIDHNFEAFFLYEEDDHGYGSVSCGDIAAAEFCMDGNVKMASVDTFVDLLTGQSGKEACCACGGGHVPTTANVLVSWRMVVYGHGDHEVGTFALGNDYLSDLAGEPERANAEMQNGDNEATMIFEASGPTMSSAANMQSRMSMWCSTALHLGVFLTVTIAVSLSVLL